MRSGRYEGYYKGCVRDVDVAGRKYVSGEEKSFKRKKGLQKRGCGKRPRKGEWTAEYKLKEREGEEGLREAWETTGNILLLLLTQGQIDSNISQFPK